ncbi:hypothetical protein HS961_07090 [Comamonas piscis]|uniref:Uncharacterized protein n=1 Tax=Comamonas piscis TaxID=1562974 RepID=A0A7G5EF47_9BURK|nr:hypothetical protein [Comamonas piscis]QMV72622.1 hypothetical protein HS961_07090 [Comamonas piscis]
MVLAAVAAGQETEQALVVVAEVYCFRGAAPQRLFQTPPRITVVVVERMAEVAALDQAVRGAITTGALA